MGASIRRVYKFMSENNAQLNTMFEGMNKSDNCEVNESEFIEGVSTLNLGLTNETAAILFGYVDAYGSESISKKELMDYFEEGAAAYDRSEFLRDALKKTLLLIFFALPIACVLLAFLFAALLTLVEGWDYEDCFYEVLASLTSTNIAVSNVPAADSDGGKLIGCLVGLYSLAILGGVIGLIGGPLLDPVIEFLHMDIEDGTRSPVKTSLLKMTGFVFLELPIVSTLF
jgi:hypothetical protein